VVECIFCEEQVSEDAEECPHCSKKPFSGMYFDPSSFDEATRLDQEGDSEGAWRILFAEWQQHTDLDYFDQEMVVKIRERIDALLDRNPELIDKRVQIMLEDCSIEAYWSGGGHDVTIIEEAMQLARDAQRPDLELEAFEHHCSIQVQRYGGSYWETEGLRDRREELRQKAADYHGNDPDPTEP